MKEVVVFVHETASLHAVMKILGEQNQLYVYQATTVIELLHRISAASIVLTDLLAPDANGLWILEQLQRQQRNVAPPVVVLTSAKNEQLAVQALRAGAASYVPSRLVARELMETLTSVSALASAHHDRSRVIECMHQWTSEFVLENDRTLIPPLVRYLQDMTQQMDLLVEPGEETRIGIALEEALLNGMYHGNLEVPSSLREEDDTKFYALIERRRQELPYAARRLQIQAQINRNEAFFVIEDNGPGFDITTVPDPTHPINVERVCGRGMLLMRTFMDEVQYNQRGNQVCLRKRRQLRDSS